ncbi:MAG TPA: ABC transporter permease [Terriglobales bacterium]|nr:ABC transporter permease [Terriglobales bacterium]
MGTFLQDIRYALRQLRKNPGFTAVAMLTLALGIGANSAIFSAVNALLLRPLPYPDRDRLVTMQDIPPGPPSQNFALPYGGEIVEWRKQDQVFDRMEMVSAAGGDVSTFLGRHGAPERIHIQFATPGFFQMLGVPLALGRTFVKSSDQTETIILSDKFWRSHFNADPNVLGQTLTIDSGYAYVVVGVLPPGFDFFSQGEVDIWRPIFIDEEPWNDARRSMGGWFWSIARLRPGVTVAQAQSALSVIAHHLEQTSPENNKGWGVRVLPLQEGLFGRYRQILYPLLTTVALVLLIACANVANLSLSRASTRQKEMAIRSAIGATGTRLVRQMLTESVLLAVFGGILGLIVCAGGIKILLALAPQSFPHKQGLTIDVRVLGFTLAIAILTGIVFGFVPALKISRFHLNETLKEGGRTSVLASRHRTRSIFVIAEIALALVLLVSAGLLVNSLFRMIRADAGFNPDKLFTLELRMSGKQYLDWDKPMPEVGPQTIVLCQQILDRVRGLPGVESAALIDWLPLVGDWEDGHSRPFTVAGRPIPPLNERPETSYNAVSPDYFRTMQIPLLQGRDVSEQDVQTSAWVVVINEAMAHRIWPNQNPIGQMITIDGLEEKPREVVGIVGNIKEFALRDRPRPQAYVSYRQQPMHTDGGEMSRIHKSLVVRAHPLSTEVMERTSKTVAELINTSPIYGLATVRELISNSAYLERFYSRLLGIFAALALLLAAIGIYGVLSYSVSERNHEIGVRMALGAQSGQVRQLILKEGVTLALIGVTVGLIASLAVSRLFSRLLFGVQPHDPVTLTLVSALMVGIAVLATYIPARRATKVAPMVALRYE